MLTTLLESWISRYLALDPDTLKRLSSFTGKVIQLELTDWSKRIYLFPSEKGIQLKDAYEGEVNAVIKGTSWVLFRVGLSNSSNNMQLTNQLDVSGDVALAHTLSRVLQQIDVDWEEPLSHLTGDVVAHQLGNVARSFSRLRKQMVSTFQLNMTEYLQEEARYLPTQEEVEDFYSEIHLLRMDVDRFEAKLQKHNK